MCVSFLQMSNKSSEIRSKGDSINTKSAKLFLDKPRDQSFFFNLKSW